MNSWVAGLYAWNFSGWLKKTAQAKAYAPTHTCRPPPATEPQETLAQEKPSCTHSGIDELKKQARSHKPHCGGRRKESHKTSQAGPEELPS
jgi:hypothetical protein